MSALIYYITEDHVAVAMDTLAMADEEGAPVPGFYATKVFLFPHLRGFMCGMGLLNFSTDWFLRLQQFVARDLLHADEFTPDVLREIALPYGFKDKHTSTIYHFGYSESEATHFGFAYRSANNFKSERLPLNGWGIKPPIPREEIYVKEFPGDIIRMMSRQQVLEDERPAAERVYIGGEIQLILLEGDNFAVSTIYRFDDYANCYDEMCLNLPANAHLKAVRDKQV